MLTFFDLAQYGYSVLVFKSGWFMIDYYDHFFYLLRTLDDFSLIFGLIINICET